MHLCRWPMSRTACQPTRLACRSASVRTVLAARYETSGPRMGELEIVEIPRPDPAPGEVLVRVRFSGVNPTDVGARGGHGFDTGHAHVVPDHDGAGEIVEVGEGVPAERIGERVWLWLAQWRRPQGTAAQFIALPSAQAVALPAAPRSSSAPASGSRRSRRTAACAPTGPDRRPERCSSRAAPAPSATRRSSSRGSAARASRRPSARPRRRRSRPPPAPSWSSTTARRTSSRRCAAWAPDGVERIIEVAIGTNVRRRRRADQALPRHQLLRAPRRPDRRAAAADGEELRDPLGPRLHDGRAGDRRRRGGDHARARGRRAHRAARRPLPPRGDLRSRTRRFASGALGKVLVEIP